MSEERQHTLTGNFRTFRNFQSEYLPAVRDIFVYLPPDYHSAVNKRRYPVFYLQDGQNVFDAATSYKGEEWMVDETAERLIEGGRIEPLIAVGIYNAGDQRIDEYTPSVDQKRQHGGKSYLYSKMLRREIKPLIDHEFRTLSGARDTGLGGSSLGGLAALSIGLRFPYVFGKLAVMSPSLWWGDRISLARVNALPSHLPLKIWLDMGLAEGDQCVDDARDLRDALEAKGWVEGVDLQHWEYPGAGHTESAWAARMGQVLEFLFPPRKASVGEQNSAKSTKLE